MKNALRKICFPILNIFEKGEEPYVYKSLNRKILIVMGILFSGLATAVVFVASGLADFGFLIPAIVFFTVAAVCFIVGFLGSERAVAKIWGNR